MLQNFKTVSQQLPFSSQLMINFPEQKRGRCVEFENIFIRQPGMVTF